MAALPCHPFIKDDVMLNVRLFSFASDVIGGAVFANSFDGVCYYCVSLFSLILSSWCFYKHSFYFNQHACVLLIEDNVSVEELRTFFSSYMAGKIV